MWPRVSAPAAPAYTLRLCSPAMAQQRLRVSAVSQRLLSGQAEGAVPDLGWLLLMHILYVHARSSPANRTSSFLGPTELNQTITFWLSPNPSIFRTVPTPNFAWRTFIPMQTPSSDSSGTISTSFVRS